MHIPAEAIHTEQRSEEITLPLGEQVGEDFLQACPSLRLWMLKTNQLDTIGLSVEYTIYFRNCYIRSLRLHSEKRCWLCVQAKDDHTSLEILPKSATRYKKVKCMMYEPLGENVS